MSSAGGGYQGPLLSRKEWREHLERGFPGLQFSGGQGRLERGGGSVLVELSEGDPVSELDLRWSGSGPGIAVRRFITEHGLRPHAAAPAPIPSPRQRPADAARSPTKRRQAVTAVLAAVGGACLLMSALLLARPHLNARLMAHNEGQVVKRLSELNAPDPASRLPVYAGYFFERPPGSASHALLARPLLPGVTGGGWFVLMEGRVYRDPEFDRQAAAQEDAARAGESEP